MDNSRETAERGRLPGLMLPDVKQQYCGVLTKSRFSDKTLKKCFRDVVIKLTKLF